MARSVTMRTIQEAARLGQWVVTRHARERAGQRRIDTDDLLRTLTEGTLLETSPDHRSGSRVLVLGHAPDGKALHLSCAFDPGGALIVITTYEPRPPQWVDERTRARRRAAP